MAFNSIAYFAFLPLVYAFFVVTPAKVRWMPLLVFSFYFYMTFSASLAFFLLFAILLNYFIALLIGNNRRPYQRLLLLWSGIVLNISLIVLSRYPVILHALLPTKGLLLSIGVSYYVFQAISYLIDIYLEIEEPERHFGYFALYMAFFPKLLQGPIERAGDLLPQLKVKYEFDYDTMRSGMLMFAWGLFKKVVVADRLALFVNIVYGDVHAYAGLPLVLATWFYAFQIYFDFSGYTDMALGTARMFNIRLTQNFNSPYLATSVADFWRRWHISFSRWILDYIFKPLQMRWRDWRTFGTALALVVTFLVSGIWHGASWGFVAWGLLHGIYLAASVYYKPLQKKIHKALGLEKTRLLNIWQTMVTFQLVCFAWIFFRANSLSDALYVVRHLFDGLNGVRPVLFAHGATELAVALAVLAVMLTVRCITAMPGSDDLPFKWPSGVRWSLYCVLVLSLCLFYVDSGRGFIYFQF